MTRTIGVPRHRPWRRRGCLRLAVAAVALVATAPAALAHQNAIKYADVRIDGADVTIELRFLAPDVTRPLGLPDDASPSVAEALAAADRVIPYVATWLAVTSAGAACPASSPILERAAADARFLAMRWTARCAAPVERLVLDLAGFFAVDSKHELLTHISSPGTDPYSTVIGRADSRLVVTLGADRPSTAFAWIWQGMLHIYTGYDHVGFVLALLLVVVIGRDASGAWVVRPGLAAARATAIVITAFTIAHSLTLITASLGWVRLPTRLVESVIALSIAYTAVEDVVKPDVRWRYGLTFGFGLIHGLGFASVLAVLLPPGEVVVPLLEFNLGVELGQLTIVAIALPVLWAAARAAGAACYRRRVLPALALPIAVLGAIWFLERAGGLTVLGL